jgi:hypothetical protein
VDEFAVTVAEAIVAETVVSETVLVVTEAILIVTEAVLVGAILVGTMEGVAIGIGGTAMEAVMHCMGGVRCRVVACGLGVGGPTEE